MAHLQGGQLGPAQPGAVGDGEQVAHVRGGGCAQQLELLRCEEDHLVLAELVTAEESCPFGCVGLGVLLLRCVAQQRGQEAVKVLDGLRRSAAHVFARDRGGTVPRMGRMCSLSSWP